VIEVLVAEGDTISPEQGLITVESDKASMEIPAPEAGVVRSVRVKVGDKVQQGSIIVDLEPAEAPEAAPEQPAAEQQQPQEATESAPQEAPAASQSAASGQEESVSVTIPDIGDFAEDYVI